MTRTPQGSSHRFRCFRGVHAGRGKMSTAGTRWRPLRERLRVVKVVACSCHEGSWLTLWFQGSRPDEKTFTSEKGAGQLSWEPASLLPQRALESRAGENANVSAQRALDCRVENTHTKEQLRAQELLAKGAAVDAANGAGVTSLIAAAFFGHEPVVRGLLRRGADARAAAAADRRTALHWAAANDHDAVRVPLEPLPLEP